MVVQKIESDFANKQSITAAFVDIKGAFDKTIHNSINRVIYLFKVKPVIAG